MRLYGIFKMFTSLCLLMTEKVEILLMCIFRCTDLSVFTGCKRLRVSGVTFGHCANPMEKV